MNKKEHLLVIVGEECTEVHQRCSKALRFGMDEEQEGQGLNNKDRILQEFNDLIAAVELLFDCKVSDLICEAKVKAKKRKIKKYLTYSIECGTLTISCPNCENPYPHRHTDGRYSCEDCKNEWKFNSDSE